MKVGDLIQFNKTGVLALIVETSEEGGYTSMNLHVLGDALKDTPCANGYTWISEHMLRRTAGVVQ